MADLLYDYGLDEWRDWASGTYTWLALRSSYTPARTDRYIATITAHELTAAGYHRSPVTSPTRTVDTVQHRITYDCADPNFGNPAAGAQIVGYVALARVVTNDADSVLMSLYDISDFTTDGGPFSPVVAAAGVHFIDQS
jgi:hypothetical protein